MCVECLMGKIVLLSAHALENICGSNPLHLHHVCIDPRTDPSRNLNAKSEGDSAGQYGVPVAYERSFKWKVSHFRNLCAVSQSYY